MMTMRNVTAIMVVACLAMAAPALAAASFEGGGGNDLWSNGANWNPAGVPTLATGQLTIMANADVQTNLADRIGGVLDVDGGYELLINADFGHALTETNQDVWLQGTITQNAGDVWFSDDMRPAGGTQTMNGGTFELRDYYRFDSTGLLDIRGGSFTIGGVSGIGLNMNNNSSTLKVVGDAATLISLGTINSFGSGTLEIVFKDGGIQQIDVTGDANLPGTLNVTVDSGSFAGDYTLISAGSLSGSIGTENLPAGWSVATVGNDLVVTAIPEPATMSLLAIGGLALIRRRKRA